MKEYRKMDGSKKVVFSIVLDKDLYLKLSRRAREEVIYRSVIISRALEKEFERK